MITVTDRTGTGAGWHAMLGSFALIVLAVLAVPPISVFGSILTVAALSVAVWQTQAAWRFVRNPDKQTARSMLRVTCPPPVMSASASETVVANFR